MTNYHEFTPDPDTVSKRMLAYAGASGTVSLLEPSAAAVQPTPAQPAPVALPTTLAGLTALRDREFVEAAYRVVLGREPDPAGMDYYLDRLRAGVLGKIEVAGALRYSGEGRQRAATLDGLGPRYLFHRIVRLPLLGWLYGWLLAVVRLPLLLRVARSQHAQMEHAAVAAEERRLRDAEARIVSTRLDMIESAVREMRGRARILSARLDAVDVGVPTLEALSARIEAQSARLSAAELAFEARHQRLTAANARLVQQLRTFSMSHPATPPAETAATPSASSAHSTVSADLDTFYLEFEDRFRGSREATKRSHEVYLDYVTRAGAGTEAAPILDIGCGRGEWLELLVEHGWAARGIDLNRAMVVDNRQRGLDVVEQDVLTYLASLPAASVRMVTGFHIIEHLPFDLLVRLFDECRRVLQPGGCVVFETPNPENLVVGAYTFYLDPTHRHPLPPQMIEFLAQQRGFEDVEVVRLHPRPEHGIDQVLLDRWFRTAVDYAVIGWRNGKAAK